LFENQLPQRTGERGYETGYEESPEGYDDYGGGISTNQQIKLIEALVESDKLPEDLEEVLGPYFGKDSVLTFLDNGDFLNVLTGFDTTVNTHLLMRYPHQHTPEYETNLSALRDLLKLRTKRSVGRGNQNERTLQATQIQQAVIDEPEPQRGGIVSRGIRGLRQAFGGGSR